jgi:3-dehydroquinate synthase
MIRLKSLPAVAVEPRPEEMITFAAMETMDAVITGPEAAIRLTELIKQYAGREIFILTGPNSARFCLPLLLQRFPDLGQAHILQIPAGESHKTIETLTSVWEQLSAGGATRSSLLINLGGGVVTDIGGFAAATYKRGMPFVNIPTTLLAMVDAALGGKTGINLHAVKNQIGVFAPPLGVFVFPEFLKTLPENQLRSGYAEMLKHALIGSENLLEEFLSKSMQDVLPSEESIRESAEVKQRIVDADPSENGLRKALNFGHTIGHALETWSQMHQENPLLHGEAVAAGLLCECYLSAKCCGLEMHVLKRVAEQIRANYPFCDFKEADEEELLLLMRHDKKNPHACELNFTLIRKAGEPMIDQYPGEALIRESLGWYRSLYAAG